MRAAGTIAAKSHIALARVVAQSFTRQHPDIPFFVLLADREDGFFDPSAEPYQILQLEDLPIPQPERFCFHHAQQPLSYAATPYLLGHLLNRGFTRVLFFKQESMIIGSQAPIFRLLDDHPIVLTPHLLEPLEGGDRAERELQILRAGAFNIGMIGVSETETAREFLAWWQDRVYAHCRLAVSEGMHYEQRWIDLVPGFFEGTHILRDPGANVGHWNLPERRVDVKTGGIDVDGGTGRLFRFSGFDPDSPDAVTWYSRRLRMETVGPAAAVFERYKDLLEEAGYRETKRWPYAFGAFDNGVRIPEVAREIYRELDEPAADVFANPFQASHPRSYYRWLNEPVHAADSAPRFVTRLWEGIYRRRLDVQRAFPNALSSDRSAFLDWTTRFGAEEHGIPRDFLFDRVTAELP